MTRLKLWFFEDRNRFELYQTEFAHPLLRAPMTAQRGYVSPGDPQIGHFPWTKGVQALCALFMHAAASGAAAQPLLSGGAGSLAASLDYALSKQSLWLLDMFGMDREGVCLVRRVIWRQNPERKRPGPVSLGLYREAARRDALTLYINGEEERRPDRLEALAGMLPAKIEPRIQIREAA